MEKVAYFFIDDAIWLLRDVANKRPKSIYDAPYFKMLKKMHDKYGLKVQINLFYRTDFFYGSKEFNLSQMPDLYKEEFQSSKDWMRFGFHAKQEFPDYPYVNAEYEDVKADFELIKGEVERFAGEGMLSNSVLPHWLPVSKAACQAFYDCGAKFLATSSGPTEEYVSGETVLQNNNHGVRVIHNRKPETKVYTRIVRGQIDRSLCAYNHVTTEEEEKYLWKNTSIPDQGIGLRYRQFGKGPCLNSNNLDEIKEKLGALIADGKENIGICVHEQYFYPDYMHYIPDIPQRIELMAKLFTEAGYRFITEDDFK